MASIRRGLMAVAALGVVSWGALGLTGCSEAGVTAQDAYKIGCPAVDAALGGGSAVSSATVAGLKALRDSQQLGVEAQQWLEATITAMEASSPDDLPAQARTTIVDGCAAHGYQLQNLGS